MHVEFRSDQTRGPEGAGRSGKVASEHSQRKGKALKRAPVISLSHGTRSDTVQMPTGAVPFPAAGGRARSHTHVHTYKKLRQHLTSNHAQPAQRSGEGETPRRDNPTRQQRTQDTQLKGHSTRKWKPLTVKKSLHPVPRNATFVTPLPVDPRPEPVHQNPLDARVKRWRRNIATLVRSPPRPTLAAGVPLPSNTLLAGTKPPNG